jgi:1,4-alpha-glucan branching enzyme
MLTIDPAAIEAIVRGDHGDPFAVLGMHATGDGALVVRTFQPRVKAVCVVDPRTGRTVGRLSRSHDAGFFEGTLDRRKRPFAYRLRLESPDGNREVEDPYRFGPVLGADDIYLLGEGNLLELYNVLGAHPRTIDGVTGVAFAVWAPNARRVSVVGDFNDWDGRVHPMRCRIERGVWELFVPGVEAGMHYKFDLLGPNGARLPLKADPMAARTELPPGTASVVWDAAVYPWSDDAWMRTRATVNDRRSPMAIYEAHLGSWRRGDDNRYLSYRELADQLVPYVRDMGFTHIELLPVMEHPFDGSWGYQPLGLFAPTSRFGSPADFQDFVDRCHREGLGVVLDWVPGHFPSDPHGLASFDGTALYEHSDPRLGRHVDWDTLIYNYGRTEVANFLIASGLVWLDRYHADGLRVDAVASMLYLDYSRQPNEWLPNKYGGNENLEAIAFLKRLNEQSYGRHDGVATIAEESTAWPMVSRPVHLGGLGFGYKWNMGWMHDTLEYMSHDPVHRRYHHDKLTFGLLYAFSENFVLPLSHDEVVHGKGSLLGKMPGDRWQRFANLRAYYGFMYGHPGKKLLFMGGEFGQEREWNHDRALDWHLLDEAPHAGLQNLVRDLNRLYRSEPALHRNDCEAEGFQWIDATDVEQSVVSFLRRGDAGDEPVVVVCNFTPVVRHGYRVGVPEAGWYREMLNTDAADYGGSGVGNQGGLSSEMVPRHGLGHSLVLTLPPLATVMLRRERG